jgi:hypothetical protein
MAPFVDLSTKGAIIKRTDYASVEAWQIDNGVFMSAVEEAEQEKFCWVGTSDNTV